MSASPKGTTAVKKMTPKVVFSGVLSRHQRSSSMGYWVKQSSGWSSRICQAGQETAKLVPHTGSKPETRYPLDGYKLYRWFRRRSRLAKTNVHITICPFLYQNTYNARKGTDSIEFLLLLFILLGSYDYPSNILCRLLFLFSLYW